MERQDLMDQFTVYKKRHAAWRFILKFLIFILAFACLTIGMRKLLLHSSQKDAHSVSGIPPENRTDPQRIVILDAGHGGEDGGTSSESGILEKDLNLSMTYLLAELLQASGTEVILTRDSDRLLYDPTADYQGKKKVLDQRARLDIVNQTVRENPTAEILFISIHMNSYPSETVRGLQVWYSKNHKDSACLAETIQNHANLLIADATVRHIKQAGSNIFLLDRLSTPAILIECGFLSNPEEARLLSEKAYQKKLAFSILTAILNFENTVNAPAATQSETASFP